MKLYKTILTGLVSLSLTACGTLSSPDPYLPPAHLLESCPGPIWPESGTNGDLAQLLKDYQLALDLCNGDKAGLRDWADQLSGEAGE